MTDVLGGKVALHRLLWLLLVLPACSAAMELRIANDRPIRARPGAEVTFVVEVTRPLDWPDAGTSGSFVDPSVGPGTRPTLPFLFGQPSASPQCNADFGVDFSPVPNFLGWFGAHGIASGATLACRVTLYVHPGASPGTYRAALDLGFRRQEFQVTIRGTVHAVPAASERWLLVALVAMMLLAGGARRGG